MADDPRPVLTPRGAALAIGVGVAFAAGLAWTGRPPEAGAGWRVAFVTLHAVGSAGVWALVTRRILTGRQLLVGAALFRLLVVPMQPALSDDGYRYLWDGLVTVETGTSPYAMTPADPRLSGLDDGVLLDRMNSPAFFSVYPPASQAVFAAAASLRPIWGWIGSWYLLKLLLLAFEGLAIVCLLRHAGSRWAALYAWSPLAVVEVAGQGHTEAIVVAGLGLVLVGGTRIPWASVGATVAGLTKLWPLALLPSTWRRDGARGVAASLALALGLCVPVWTPEAVSNAGESLGLFFGTFDEYAAPYRLLKSALYPVVGEGAGLIASGALTLGLLLALTAAWLGDDGTRRTLARFAVVLVLGVALTSTTLHPWYGLPVLYMLPLLQSRLPLFWVASASNVGYLGYVLPAASLGATVVGWGGGLLLWLWPRRHRREHGIDRR